MRNIRAYTNTHSHTHVEICNTWLALKRDQIKDCLLFYEWLKDSKQPLNVCHTVLFITGMSCRFDSPTWSWCSSSTQPQDSNATLSYHTRGFMGGRIWSSHWRSTRTNQGLLICCLSLFSFVKKYISIYVKRFIFFVSVICVSVTIKSIHLV